MLYLKHKKYAPSVLNEHMKRNVRKMSESHYIKDDILYHSWKTVDRMVPLRFDERYYILEAYHVDNKGINYVFFQSLVLRFFNLLYKGYMISSGKHSNSFFHLYGFFLLLITMSFHLITKHILKLFTLISVTKG